MNAANTNSMQMLRTQAAALIGLRWTVWRRKLNSEGKWTQLAVGLLALLFGLSLTGLATAGIFFLGQQLHEDPKSLEQLGGPLALCGLLLSAMLALRLYFSILSLAAGTPFLHPRRFLIYAVPPLLVTTINCIAQLFEPAWVVFYAPAVMLAYVSSSLPGGPKFLAMLVGLKLLFLCAAAVMQLLTSMVAELFAHKASRRIASLSVLGLGWGISFAASHAANSASAFAPAHLWKIVRVLPPGWAVLFADALSHARILAALAYAAALIVLTLAAAFATHALSLRESRRPAETTIAREANRAGPAGWVLPFLPGPICALIEKETKTIFRAMWLQMIAGPVGFLMMRFLILQGAHKHDDDGLFVGPQPLLMGAVYAHLGVLAWAVNLFGVDGQATRGVFLWPVRGRTVLAAKNAVTYVVSLGIFLLLAAISLLTAPLTAEQIFVGLCAHAATFPVLAALGNTTSIYFPAPMKSGRMVRQPGGSAALARIGALLAMALTGWAPYAIAKVIGLPLVAAYVSEFITMAIVYGGLLSFSEQMLETRREQLLQALAKDE